MTYSRKIRAFPLLRGFPCLNPPGEGLIILSNPGVIDKTTARGADVFQSPRVYMEGEGQETAWAPDFRRLPPAAISTACLGREFPTVAAPAVNPRVFEIACVVKNRHGVKIWLQGRKSPPLAQTYHYSRQGEKKPRMADFKICKILRNFHYEIYF